MSVWSEMSVFTKALALVASIVLLYFILAFFAHFPPFIEVGTGVGTQQRGIQAN